MSEPHTFHVSDGATAPSPVVPVYVGLGSNAGDRLSHLRAGVAALAGVRETVVEGVSAVYETEAHVLPGQPPQPDHLNAVAFLRTTADPFTLLDAMQAAERAAGRDPLAPPWSARPLDLDLLLYGGGRVESPPPAAPLRTALVVPHPRLAARRFVLAPLADVAPGVVVPGLGRTVAELLAACPDRARVARTLFRLDVPPP